MEIILLQDVDKLGKKGDVANVAEGYARNFLLPRKLAEIATPSRVAAAKQTMEERAGGCPACRRAGRRDPRDAVQDRAHHHGRGGHQ